MTGSVLRSSAFHFSRHQPFHPDKRSSRRRPQVRSAPYLLNLITHRGVLPTSITTTSLIAPRSYAIWQTLSYFAPQSTSGLPSEHFDGKFYSDEDAGVAMSFQLSNPENPSGSSFPTSDVSAANRTLSHTFLLPYLDSFMYPGYDHSLTLSYLGFP